MLSASLAAEDYRWWLDERRVPRRLRLANKRASELREEVESLAALLCWGKCALPWLDVIQRDAVNRKAIKWDNGQLAFPNCLFTGRVLPAPLASGRFAGRADGFVRSRQLAPLE